MRSGRRAVMRVRQIVKQNAESQIHLIADKCSAALPMIAFSSPRIIQRKLYFPLRVNDSNPPAREAFTLTAGFTVLTK